LTSHTLWCSMDSNSSTLRYF